MSRALFFDLDGTLTDPGEGITRCVEYALQLLGHNSPPRQELSWCIGPPLADSFARLLETEDQELIEAAIGHYRERFVQKGMLENVIYPGTRDELKRLVEAGHDLWVVTSKPTVYAEQIIAHFDLAGFFRRVHGPDLDGTRSDKRELIAHVLQEERLGASDGPWMIGDRSHDVLGARANGLHAIGVGWGYGSHEELRDAGASAIIDSFAGLRTLLESPDALEHAPS